MFYECLSFRGNNSPTRQHLNLLHQISDGHPQFIGTVLMGHTETWSLLVSLHTDFNHPGWIAWSKSKVNSYLSNYLLTPTALLPPPQEKLVCRLFVPFKVWPHWSDLSALPSPAAVPIQSPGSSWTHLKVFACGGRFRSLIGQVKALCLRAPLPMATALRDSQGEDKLLHYTSPFFCFRQQPLRSLFFFLPPLPLQFCFDTVRKRCGSGWWSTPSVSSVPLWR